MPVRSIRKHYNEQHQGLLVFEALHRDHFYGLTNLGSGKGQYILCSQQCIDVGNHQCGVLMQVSVLLGQTYDAAHFRVMPIMMRPASNSCSTLPPLPIAQESPDGSSQAMDRVETLPEDDREPELPLAAS